MDSPLPQKYLQIQIQDDLKYDVRIENAELERYFLLPSSFGDVFSEICIAANFTMRMIQAIS